MRAISELVSEKVKLATKAHAASMHVCGLPHLSVSEMRMVKRLAVDKSAGNERIMHELHELASVLDTQTKWNAKRHVFFDWMVSSSGFVLEALDCSRLMGPDFVRYHLKTRNLEIIVCIYKYPMLESQLRILRAAKFCR